MAASQDTGSSVQSKESNVNQGKYKCCTTKECAVKVCVNCYSIYHKSCAERLSNIKLIDTGKVICCEDIVPQQVTLNDESWKLKLENKYLTKLLGEMEEKNNILKENNNLLRDMVLNLKEQLITVRNMNGTLEETGAGKKDVKTKALSGQTTSKNSSQEMDKTDTRQGKNNKNKQLDVNNKQVSQHQAQHGNKQATNSVPTGETNLEDLEKKQRKIMTDVINLAPTERLQENRIEQSRNYNGVNNWQTTKRKSRPLKRNIGESEGHNQNFKGVEPKIWMYLYRVTEDVTEEDIKHFLKMKTHNADEEFIVKDLREPGKKWKSYMVGADLKFKTEFYQPSFWPRGVHYKRFNFKLYQEKYGTRHISDDTFLEVTSRKLVHNT